MSRNPDHDDDPAADRGAVGSSLESLLSPRLLDDPSPEPAVMRNTLRQRLFGGPATVFRIDRFIVVGRIGAGAMGVVFEAYDPQLERTIALKLLHPHADRDPVARERMLREARSLAKLSHPNVVSVFEVGEHGDDVFIAMELVRGQTLYDYARQPGRSAAQIIEVYGQAARGLAAAHQQGLVHRDFKPTNALVGEHGRVRVLDFGLARPQGSGSTADEPELTERAEPPSRSPSLTQTGTLVGTPAYMAPEQAAGEPATPSSDQYSLCASLFDALSGEQPLERERSDLRPDEMKSCPRALRPVLARGLARDPEHRWPSMQALAAALERIGHRRRRGGLVLGLVGSAALVTAVLWPPGSPCDASEAALTLAQRDQAELHLQQASAELAPLAMEALDDYASTWSDIQAQTCVAHHEQHAISGQLFDRAMLCLQRRRSALSGLVDGLVALDQRGAARIIDAIDALPGLEHCRDHAVLMAQLPPPEDPEVAAAVREIQADLDRALTLGRLGNLDASLQLAHDGSARARALGYRPIEARAALAVGTMQLTRGELDQVVAQLDQALWLAEAGGDDELVARCSGQLTIALATQGKSQEARAQARRTDAAIERLGRLTQADVLVSDARGIVAKTEGRFQQAREHFERALEQAQRLPDSPASVIGEQLDRLAAIERDLGREDLATAMLERAQAFKVETLGPLHPSVLATRFHVATSEISRGHLDRAIEDLQAVLHDVGRSLGYRSVLAGMIHGNLNIAHTRAGHEAEALEHAERSVEILREALDPEDPKLLAPLMNLGATYTRYGRFDLARATFEQTIALGRATVGGGADLGSALLDLANLDVHHGDPADGLRRANEAIPMLELAIDQPTHHELSRAHGVVSDAQRTLGDLAAAEAAAQRSRDRAPPGSPSRMLAQFTLAQLAAERGRPEDAREHGLQAVALAEALGDSTKVELYRQWLAAQPEAP